MIAISPELSTILASRQWVRTHLVKITIPDEPDPIRLSDGQVDIVAGTETYLQGFPLLTVRSLRSREGLAVQTFEFRVTPRSTDLLLGRSWRLAVQDGVLDGAAVDFFQAMTPPANPGDASAGLLHLFSGTVADVTPQGLEIVVSCNSLAEGLSQPVPRRVYQAGCVHALFDAGCGVSRASHTDTLTVGAGSTATSINVTSGRGAGYYALGALRVTTGTCRGIRRLVRAFNGSALELTQALPRAPAAGDQIAVSAGCDKTDATCAAKFANLSRFRGFPRVPVAETAI